MEEIDFLSSHRMVMSTNNNLKEIARGFNVVKEAAGSFVKWKMKKKSTSKMKKWTLKWRLHKKRIKKKECQVRYLKIKNK